MVTNEKVSGGNSSSLLQAKRVFLVNSALFVCLLLIATFLLLDGNEETTTESSQPIAEREWSMPELAYLKGKMQALREYPGAMPKYEEEWVRMHSEKAILRDREFAGIDKARADALVNAYFRGYTDHFNEYYNTDAARELGYQHGIKFNPDLHGLSPETDNLLKTHRKRLVQTFKIPDEAAWRLFCEAFHSGFVQGYPVIEKGITAESLGDKITFLDSP